MRLVRVALGLLLALAAALPGRAAEPEVYAPPALFGRECGEELVRTGAVAGPVNPVDVLVPTLDAGKALRQNIVGASVFLVALEYYLRGSTHRLALTTEPFAFRDVAHFAAFAESPLFEEWAEDLAAAHRVRLLALAFLSQKYVVSKKPLSGVTDFDGVKLAGGASWLRPLGVAPVMVPAVELVEAARVDAIDGAVVVLSLFKRAALHEAFPFVHEHPVGIQSLGFFIPEPEYAAMPRGQRERLASAAREAARACSAALFEQDAAIYEGLARQGVKRVSADMAALADAMRRGRADEAARHGWNAEDLRRLEAVR